MSRRALDVVRGLTALAALAAMVLGVPAALVAFVGWPLPTAAPSLQQVGDALTTTGVSDGTIVKVVALVVWLAWLQLAVAVAVEVVAVVRRRSLTPPVLGPFRRLAASLLASVTLMVGSLGVARANVPSPLSPAVAAAASGEVPSTAQAASLTAPAPAAPAASTTAEWRVQPRDTLWGIAERALGRGDRWREIHDRNVGREVAPGVRYGATTDALLPGWVLALPAGAVQHEATVRVRPGDTLTGLAARHYGDAAAWRQLWEANRGRTFDGRRFTDPNLIVAGWELILPSGGTVGAAPAAGPSATRPADSPSGNPVPGTTAGAPSATSVAPGDGATGAGGTSSADAAATATVGEGAATVARGENVTSTGVDEAAAAAGTAGGGAATVARGESATSTGADEAASAVGAGASSTGTTPTSTAATTEGVPPAAPADLPVAPASRGSARSLPLWVRPTGVAGAALLAAGLAGMVAARRRQRLRAAPPHGRVEPLREPLARLDATARAVEDVPAVVRLEVALRALAAGLRDHPTTRPLVVLRHHDGTLEARPLAGEACPTAGPWASDYARWTLAPDVPLATLVAAASDAAPPCPALVQLGTSGDAEVFVDLEAAGVLAVMAPEPDTAAVLRAVVATLAVSPLATLLHVVAAPHTAASCLPLSDRLRIVPDPAGDPTALAIVDDVQRALPEHATTFSARASLPTEAWDPVVLVGAAMPAALAERTRRGGGLAVVIDHAVPDALRFELASDGTWRLGDLDLPIAAVSLAAGELDDVAELLATADLPVVEAAPAVDLPMDGPTAADELDDVAELLATADLAVVEGAPAANLLADAPTAGADREPPTARPLVGAGAFRDVPAETASPFTDRHWLDEFSRTRATPDDRAVHAAADAATNGRSADRTEGDGCNPAATDDEPERVLPWTYLVRVLGPVDVVDSEGVPVLFERAKALELVVWLAQHRASASRLGARTALWSTDVRDSTFANVVSDARRSLGRAVAPPEGTEWVGRNDAERLPLHPLVRTDLELLAEHVARARAGHQPDAELEAALALVRGTPYCGAPYLWPDGEGLTSNALLLVVTAACELAQRRLAAGDIEGVFTATATGMAVLPGHEELVCLRMEAHAARGDLRGVRAEYDAFERIVLADAWGDGAISQKVVATRNRLLQEAPPARERVASVG